MNQIMLMMHGTQCSGKSTVSRKLSQAFHFILIGIDDIRLKLFEKPEPIKEGPLETYHVYYSTLKVAEKYLRKGHSVIIDGTFSQKLHREGAYFLAQKVCVPLYIIECTLSNYGLIRARYEERKRKNNVFPEWQEIEHFHRKFKTFERLEIETLPDGQPIPIISYNSETNTAEIIYSDGSEIMDKIMQALSKPEMVKV